MLSIQKGAISPMSLRIAASDISQGQNWCCLFKKVQYRLCHCVLLHLIYHKDKTGVSIKKGAISPMSLRIAGSDISQGQNWCCVFKKVQYRPMPLHIAASAISQGQNWCSVFKKVQYRPMPLHIAAPAISQGQNWCCVFKTVQYRL